jgi:hypothetical protein
MIHYPPTVILPFPFTAYADTLCHPKVSLVVEVSGFNLRRAKSLKVLNQDPLYQPDVIPLCHNFIRCNRLLSCNVKKKRIFPRRMMPSERKRNSCSRHLKTEKVKITKEYTFYLQGTFRKFKIQLNCDKYACVCRDM